MQIESQATARQINQFTLLGDLFKTMSIWRQAVFALLTPGIINKYQLFPDEVYELHVSPLTIFSTDSISPFEARLIQLTGELNSSYKLQTTRNESLLHTLTFSTRETGETTYVLDRSQIGSLLTPIEENSILLLSILSFSHQGQLSNV